MVKARKKVVKKKEQSKTKQTILAISIALLTVFFIAYATQALYPSPQYEDYCGRSDKPQMAETQTDCEALGGTWNDWAEKVPERSNGWCDFYTECTEQHNKVKEPYERNVFIINLILGLAILIGTFFLSIEAISTGFMGGGALLMIYGTLRYWGELNDLLRTLFLGIALAILVYFGYKKLR